MRLDCYIRSDWYWPVYSRKGELTPFVVLPRGELIGFAIAMMAFEALEIPDSVNTVS